MSQETTFASWSAAETPLSISYSGVVIEEIRSLVAEGFQKFARGGMEVGGVLYGNREGNTIRILATQEIQCEHALGPSFALSEKDHAAFALQKSLDAQDSRLEGMTPVGWFLSHTRSDVMLSPMDCETYARYFRQPWQVTLVIRPERGGAMRAGFFVWEADGSVHAQKSYREFEFPDRLAALFDRTPLGTPSSANQAAPTFSPDVQPVPLDKDMESTSAAAAAARTSVPTTVPRTIQREIPVLPQVGRPADVQAPSFGGYSSEPSDRETPPPAKRRWMWVTAGILVAAGIAATVGLGIGRGRLFFRTTAEPIALSVSELGGQLQIQWDRSSGTVTHATKGSLVIRDGSEPRTIELRPRDLTLGNFSYARKTGDVEVRLNVEDANGLRTEEASRFIGRAPAEADPAETDTITLQRDALQDEVTRLREENAQQAARIQQLQRTMVILQSRLGITEGR